MSEHGTRCDIFDTWQLIVTAVWCCDLDEHVAASEQ